MIGLGRNASYEAAKAGDIPVLEIGALKIVPRLTWLKKIGAEIEFHPPAIAATPRNVSSSAHALPPFSCSCCGAWVSAPPNIVGSARFPLRANSAMPSL